MSFSEKPRSFNYICFTTDFTNNQYLKFASYYFLVHETLALKILNSQVHLYPPYYVCKWAQ